MQLSAPVRSPHTDTVNPASTPSQPTQTEANSSLMDSEPSKDINRDIISETDNTPLLDNDNQRSNLSPGKTDSDSTDRSSSIGGLDFIPSPANLETSLADDLEEDTGTADLFSPQTQTHDHTQSDLDTTFTRRTETSGTQGDIPITQSQLSRFFFHDLF